jgi:hypothetical protein
LRNNNNELLQGPIFFSKVLKNDILLVMVFLVAKAKAHDVKAKYLNFREFCVLYFSKNQDGYIEAIDIDFKALHRNFKTSMENLDALFLTSSFLSSPMYRPISKRLPHNFKINMECGCLSLSLSAQV